MGTTPCIDCGKPRKYRTEPRIRCQSCYWKSMIGKPNNSSTKFKKGNVAWSKLNPDKMPHGERNHKWVGDKVNYFSLHTWVQRERGRAKKCENCGSTRCVQWANKSWEYKRESSDWVELCAKCHYDYDRNNVGAGVRRRTYAP